MLGGCRALKKPLLLYVSARCHDAHDMLPVSHPVPLPYAAPIVILAAQAVANLARAGHEAQSLLAAAGAVEALAAHVEAAGTTDSKVGCTWKPRMHARECSSALPALLPSLPLLLLPLSPSQRTPPRAGAGCCPVRPVRPGP